MSCCIGYSGAKGVLYYCYNSEPCGRGGVLHERAPASGGAPSLSRGRHYRHASRINSVLRVFGRYLVAATSTGVYRVQPTGTGDTGYTNTCAIGERDCPGGEQPSTDLTTCAIFNVSSVHVRCEFPTHFAQMRWHFALFWEW